MAVEFTGFQKPINPGARREVGLAVVTYSVARDRQVAECSCGWAAWHRRLKVLDDKIDKHLNKQHNGRGIRL